MARDMRRPAWLVACALFGCGPVVLPADGDGSASASSETSAGTGGSATSSTTTLGTTGGPSTATIGASTASDGVVDDGTDDGWGGFDCGAAPPGQQPRCIGRPESACDPQPMPGLRAGVSVDGGALPEGPLTNPYVYTCTIDSWQDEGLYYSFALACADGEHTLDVHASVDIWFDTTGELVLSVIHSDDTWEGGDQLATLRRAGGELVLAGASTPWPPDDEQIPPDFFAPLGVTLLADACPLEPPPNSDFLTPCYTLERQALRFTLDGASVDVYDRGVDQLAPYILAVEAAEHHHDIMCTDIGERWYSWIAVPPVLD